MPYFDRFDICEAYLALEIDWNVSGLLQERHNIAEGAKPMSVSFQLHRMHFRPRWGFKGYESLSENGQAIYDAFVLKHRLCSGCEGECVGKWGVTCDMRLSEGALCPAGSPGCDGESCEGHHEVIGADGG
jgi:hypothetical protein